MMSGFAYDWVMRVTFGWIAIVCMWVPTHVQVRDRMIRHVLLAIAMVCVLILIHLPRLTGVVVQERSAPTMSIPPTWPVR